MIIQVFISTPEYCLFLRWNYHIKELLFAPSTHSIEMSVWMNKIHLEKTLSYHMNCIENEYSTRLNHWYRFHVRCGVNASLFSYTYQCSLIWNNKIPYFRIVSQEREMSLTIHLFVFFLLLTQILSSITSVLSLIPPFTLIISQSSQESVQLHFVLLFRAVSSHFGPSVSYLGRKQRRSVFRKCCLFTSMDSFKIRWPLIIW